MTRYATTIATTALVLVSLQAPSLLAQARWQVESPSDQVAISLRLAAPGRAADYPVAKKRLYYEVTCRGEKVIALSPLGITRADQDFLDELKYVKATGTDTVEETYAIPHGKRLQYHARGKEKIVTFENARGAKLEIVLRAYDDGVAFSCRTGGGSGLILTMGPDSIRPPTRPTTRMVSQSALPRRAKPAGHFP
jgi:alpha-glucosidase